MAAVPSTNLVNLGDLTKPADTLIRKVANAVGGLFAPHQIKRLARAEAEAALIKEQTQVEITDLHRRAVRRWVEEEAQRQENMEDITAAAIPQLRDDTDATAVEDDWIVNFFDRARIVSDERMQKLWSRILAGEANAPGTYSKRTVNFLSDLDKLDAELFTKLCMFNWQFNVPAPLVFDVDADIYKHHGLSFGALTHLDSIGLVQFNNITGFRRIGVGKRCVVYYFGRELQLEMPNDADNDLDIGKVLLTRIGQELAPICDGTPVNGFMEYVGRQWQQYLPKQVLEQ